MSFTVRRIEQKDVAGYRSALDSIVGEREYLLTVTTPSFEIVTEFVHRNIADNNAQYVAVVNKRIVGWADIVAYEKELIKHAGLLGMGVVSEYRGRGIGKELLSQTIKHAIEVGLTRIELEVFARNTVAIALYHQLGFELEGTKRNGRFIDNQYVDVCCMALCV